MFLPHVVLGYGKTSRLPISRTLHAQDTTDFSRTHTYAFLGLQQFLSDRRPSGSFQAAHQGPLGWPTGHIRAVVTQGYLSPTGRGPRY
jgi:hypothetical protein